MVRENRSECDGESSHPSVCSYYTRLWTVRTIHTFRLPARDPITSS
jgi:hypothetical protein